MTLQRRFLPILPLLTLLCPPRSRLFGTP